MNDAATCHKNGWKVGDHLMGDEGRGPEVIRITAVGEYSILARLVWTRGKIIRTAEHEWTLALRDWKKVVFDDQKWIRA